MYVSNDPSVWTNVCSSECLVENVYVTINVIFVSVAVKNCHTVNHDCLVYYDHCVSSNCLVSNVCLLSNDSSLNTTVCDNECPVKDVYLYT